MIRYCCNSLPNDTHTHDCPRRADVGNNIDPVPEPCMCPGAVYDEHAAKTFDPDPYDCTRCGHMNGSHDGPNGECSVGKTATRAAG